MFSDEVVEKLKERYSNVHPLLFARCKDRAKSDVELFDLLEDLASYSWEKPLKWNDSDRIFSSCRLFQSISTIDF